MKTLNGNEVQALKPWTFPEVKNAQSTSTTTKSPNITLTPKPDKKSLETQQKALQDEAFNKGYAEGLAAGKQLAEETSESIYQEKWQRKLELVNLVLQELKNPLSKVDEELENSIIELVMKLTRQFLHAEIKMHPQHIVTLVKQALTLLPNNNKNMKIYVHPNDISLLEHALPSDYVSSLTPDETLQPGECRFNSEQCELDATIDARLATLFEQVFHE